MIDPPTGFYLQPSDKTKRGQLYGPTTPASAANWNISQWDIPADLPAFDEQNISQNQWARVVYQNGVLTLSQDAQNAPCTKHYPSGHDLPREWAMFAAPNSAQDPGFPRATKLNEPLSSIASLTLTNTITLTTLKLLGGACPTSKAFLVANIVLMNKATHQVMFYGVGFANYLTKGGATFPQLGAQAAKSAKKGTMYFNGVNNESGAKNFFGYGVGIDAISSLPQTRPGQTQHYKIDLLPGLLAAIAQGKRDGLSQALNDWVIGGYYQGQTVEGHIILITKWSNFSLTLKKKQS